MLGPQAEDNVWSLTPEERRAMGYKELPSSLGVALTEMENSELVAEAWLVHRMLLAMVRVPIALFFSASRSKNWSSLALSSVCA